jgi:uncharacterized lipoprotein YddW (UPF0748 family)
MGIRFRRTVPALALAAGLGFLPLARSSCATPPKTELRAVWITTASGLDWPKSTDRREQEASLRAIVRRLHADHFNTIFFQVRPRGDALYRSHYEPWAEQLGGALGRDPGWDPLKVVLDEAHGVGMEVHGWFNAYKIRARSTVRSEGLPHPAEAHPSWTVDADGELWFDPGLPAVRRYLLDVLLDLVKGYDLDGVNFDFIRYPSADFADDATYRRYGSGESKADWRRENVTRFVREAYERCRKAKPWLKVGSSPLGTYAADPPSGSEGSYAGYYQDSQGWLAAGIQDYLAPQVYWNIGASRGDPDFASLVRSWSKASSGRHVYAGIGAYKPDVQAELARQIDLARSAGLSGQAFFRLEHVFAREAFGGRYDTPALVPPMPWRDPRPPSPPRDLAVSEVATNLFLIEWKAPRAAADGDTASWYVVYRSSAPALDISDPSSILAVLPGSATSWVDTIRIPTGVTYYYAVASHDRARNESAPSTVASAAVKALLTLARVTTSVTSMSVSVGAADGRPTLAAYRLAGTVPVTLDLLRVSQPAPVRVARLVDERQGAGTYVVGLQDYDLRQGTYLLQLQAGTATVEQSLNVPR